MASWEDEDDWETEANQLVSGIDLNEVDEAKFADEEAIAKERAWDEDVPSSQPKRVTESRYAERDARDAAAAAASIAVDPTDAAAVKRAQEDAEMRMMAEQVGDSAAAPPPLADLAKQNEAAKSKADFEALAAAAFDALGEPHTKSKQYKTYVKALAKAFCDKLDKEGIKDVETALAGQRSEKVKAELAANAAVKKGGKKSVKMERDDIEGWDNADRYGGYGDADDDVDFM